MNLQQSLKIAVTVLILLFCTTGFTQEKESFGERMKNYSETQKIAEFFVCGKRMLLNKRDDIVWHSDVDKLYQTAKDKTINGDRIAMMTNLHNILGPQKYNNFEQLDRFINDDFFDSLISNKQQLIFAIAICKQVAIFPQITNNASAKQREAITKARQNLHTFENESLLQTVQERFSDDELKGLTEDYLKLFPDAKHELFFYKGKNSVNNMKECTDLFQACMAAYWSLDKCSSLADFKNWGKHMLNYLLLDYHPVMVEEFKTQLKNHKESFKVK